MKTVRSSRVGAVAATVALSAVGLLCAAQAWAQPAQQPVPQPAPQLAPQSAPQPAPPKAAQTASPGPASDRADIDRTRIIGNRELPKVLYIVPWKKPLPGELSPRPAGSVLDEALAPVDRDVFRRQVQYDAQIKPLATSAATPAAAATAR